MTLSEDIRRKLIATFQAEQREHLQTMMQGLLQLEDQPMGPNWQATLDEIFRAAHSLKGSARAVGITAVESIGHALEELLSQLRHGRLPLSADLFDLLYQAIDALELLLAQLEKGDSSPPATVLQLLAQLEAIANAPEAATPTAVAQPSPNIASSPFSKEENVRVAVDKLDLLMAQLNELVGVKIRIEQRLTEIDQLDQFAQTWQKQWQGLRGLYHTLLRDNSQTNGRSTATLFEFLNHNQEQLRHLNSQSSQLQRQFKRDLLRFSLIIDDLEAQMRQIRLLPLSTLTDPLRRMVRDLARQQQKSVSLQIVGDETELDRHLLEQVKDPLLHLLRNAVDHGVETAVTRQATAKPAQATIQLTAVQQANHLILTISDDGSGIDPDQLRQTAVANGLLTPAQAQTLTNEEALQLVFRSGFSTSRQVSPISGRGVGLDIVRQNVALLNGQLQLQSQVGQGSTFTLTLPLSVASSHGLLLQAGGHTFALPLAPIERLLRIRADEITAVDGQAAIIYHEQAVRLVTLADLLQLPRPETEAELSMVVLLNVAGKRLALVVDSLDSEQEIVIKNLGSQLRKVAGFMGATLLGSGQLILVLHAADLLKLAERTPSTAVNAQPALVTSTAVAGEKLILVVDDSITMRTLEKNILEAQGYLVWLATNGEEALSLLWDNGRLPDLIISDVNMPRLDGFELTQRLKQDGRTKQIPVILVTSLDSVADKTRGIEVGADAYIVKNRFDQNNLLQMIHQLTL